MQAPISRLPFHAVGLGIAVSLTQTPKAPKPGAKTFKKLKAPTLKAQKTPILDPIG